jgi:hypothetical protein
MEDKQQEQLQDSILEDIMALTSSTISCFNLR